jgi:hypothetical protein
LKKQKLMLGAEYKVEAVLAEEIEDPALAGHSIVYRGINQWDVGRPGDMTYRDYWEFKVKERAENRYVAHGSIVSLPKDQITERRLLKGLTFIKFDRKPCTQHRFKARTSQTTRARRNAPLTDLGEIDGVLLTLGRCDNCGTWLIDCFDQKTKQSWWEEIPESLVDRCDAAAKISREALRDVVSGWQATSRTK